MLRRSIAVFRFVGAGRYWPPGEASDQVSEWADGRDYGGEDEGGEWTDALVASRVESEGYEHCLSLIHI